MELKRITLPPINAPGEVTTLYAYANGLARSAALSSIAAQLAAGHNATVPVLMIDWDTDCPGLHLHFGCTGDRPGLLEYFQACRDYLDIHASERGAPGGSEALARQVLAAIDWERYVERVDEGAPLYLMRAGQFDDSYGERADRMDWDGLFAACPALFRCFGQHLAQRFRHVLIDAPSGRSAAVSICTTLLPDKLVGLFAPGERSLDGLCGAVTRAIDYRRSHEDEQRPLLVYPVACHVDSSDAERRHVWRRGDPARHIIGYQSVLEKLLRECYGLSHASLESYCDEVQLPALHAAPALVAARLARSPDRFAPARCFDALLEWVAEGRFPWQSLAEVRLTAAVAAARALDAGSASGAVSLPLAEQLALLGAHYRAQARHAQAIACVEEALALRQRVLGTGHPLSRATRVQLADALAACGRLAESASLRQALVDDCAQLQGDSAPETLAARSALAVVMSLLGEHERALALHERVVAACEAQCGMGAALTLDCLAAQARALAAHGARSRARMVYERVLEGRERLLGAVHADTLACAQQLALLLADMGDLSHARKLQEGVVAVRDRRLGQDHALALDAREQLAEILAGQGDIDGVREVVEQLAAVREHSLGAEHPATLSSQLKLASMLFDEGKLDAARRLQQKLVGLHERVLGHDDLQTLTSKQALATTLSRQGHSDDAYQLEDAVLQGSERLIGSFGMACGPHASHAGALGLRDAILDGRDSVVQADTLGQKLIELQQLIDNSSEREARALADSLRKSVLRPSAAHPLRLRGVALIKQVYLRENDKDALLSFAQDEVSSLQEALLEAASRP